MNSETYKIDIEHAMTYAEKNIRSAWNCIQTGDLRGLAVHLQNTSREVEKAKEATFDLRSMEEENK